MSNFNVKVRQENGKYYLSISHNGYQWTSMIIGNPEQMRQIAKALIAKAKEIDDYEQIMNEPNKFCEDCGCVLHDDNIMTIVKSNPEIYVCIDCYTKD